MVIDIKNLNCSVNGIEILHGLSLKVQKKEIVVIKGNNGSGKSTLAKIIAGDSDYEINYQRFNLFGRDCKTFSISEKARQGLFVGFQKQPTFDNIQIKTFLTELSTIYNYKKADSIIDNLNLAKLIGQPVGAHLSGGESKRLEMAQAIIIQPKLAIFDEIDSGTDAETKKIFTLQIKKMQKEGSAVIIITHNSDFSNMFNNATKYTLKNKTLVKK